MAKNTKIELVRGGRKVDGQLEATAPDSFKDGKGIYQTQKDGSAKLLSGKGPSILPFEPRVSAPDLTNPPQAPRLTAPREGQISPAAIQRVRNVATDLDGIIEADTAESQRLKQLRDEQAAFGFDGYGLYNNILDQHGARADMFKLKQYKLQLADMDTMSDITKSRIAGAQGQTLTQGQREITQEEKEESIRQMGIAAKVSVLQDNIDMATKLAGDAVKYAFQDAQLSLQNRTNQINDLRSTVDKQTQQLLDQELRAIEAEQARVKEVKDAVQAAILAGASQADIDAMLSPETPDDEKLRIAQNAQAASARTDIALDRAAKNASINASNLSARKSQLEIAALENTNSGAGNIAVQALDNFSGSLNENNRVQYTQAVAGAVARGDVQGTEIALKNAAQAAAGKAMTEDVIKRDQAIGALRDVKKAIADYEAAGGKTNLLTGGYETLQNKLGQSSDPKLAAIETRINLGLNAYTNAVSGASFTPQESARYQALFPATTNESVLNTTKIDTLLDVFEANNQVFYGNFYGGATPSELAEQAIYEELIASATDEELAELNIQR